LNTYAPWAVNLAHAVREDAVTKPGSHTYLVFTRVRDGLEAEFNSWYDTVHIPEILTRCTGFIAAQRFKLCDAQRPGSMPEHTYLCVYEIEGDSGESLASLDQQAAQPDWTRTDALDYSALSARLYEAITERFEAGKIVPPREKTVLPES
jgi:hypothetical protein